ncbi:regulatory protein RecX [Sphingomonas sp.]|uniref:regulatory protein RecX n=1 Tax=Sphingomonas sp. TaxID=28214 RepID=UPI00389C3DC5
MKTRSRPRSAPAPLDADRLRELALRYVGKYATTRAKLRQYLTRKVRERGWAGDDEPDLDQIGDRFAELGYVNDGAFAMAKSRALSARGYGKRRLADQLRMAGVDEDDGAAATVHADQVALDSALRLAERKRFGPFANAIPDPAQREKWIAAMVRAGHGFALAKTIAGLPPGAEIDIDQLRERFPVIEA